MYYSINNGVSWDNFPEQISLDPNSILHTLFVKEDMLYAVFTNHANSSDYNNEVNPTANKIYTYNMDNMVGLETNHAETLIGLYPSVSSSDINITGINEIFHFDIYDIRGGVCMSGDNENIISISMLKAGLYIVKISVDDQEYTLKFIKK